MVHRSPAGVEREIVVGGVPVCARCAAIWIGVATGFLVGAVATLPWWLLVLACLPAVGDALSEKRLGGPHRPRLLVASNALAGMATSIAFLSLLRGYGPVAAVLALGVARVVLIPVREWAVA